MDQNHKIVNRAKQIAERSRQARLLHEALKSKYREDSQKQRDKTK